ncbi:site-2 protease family protein [Natronobacterium gregoryi]|uniref:Membrane-associated Zn-dependent protease n=2 Tax=Natronobacterium gregoryi TaxID=44930 RepID=L0AKN6_NATGS|nr:site-2 protease family protein [Natronobacterium gregoryi]AFZ73590.1 putative membrane-associated Zn-dependent protease [Natronobacterium gregoryi SP2]ELY68152.1 peptidase M50 [Natronobacterium gregoryi SP2]PLK20023.1 site-2 protease family protein [Natronobacterium gregoryi SP2]SFJ34829.1 Peptidase family M50 [Natronobacterium gregoryi]
MDDGDRPGIEESRASDAVPAAGPSLERIESMFTVYESTVEDETLIYYGDPRVQPEQIVQELWPVFREEGYDLRVGTRYGEYVLVAEPTTVGIDGIPWTNVLLLALTIVSTLFAGSMWYHIDPIANPEEMWRAWPFTVAILGVLGVHEMGHYLLSRYHQVDASLPYFIPIPTLIGTMGAVIKMKGRMPDRKALFDIGVAGPLAGLVATIAVTIVGLHLPPVTAPETVVQDPDAVQIQLGYPPLLELLAAAFDQPLYRDDPATAINPVVVGGWVGMFVTFLNLIPVGQLDGGHILRAMAGRSQETIAALVPGALFGLAAYLYYVADYGLNSVLIWGVWGLFAAVLASVGPAHPVDDEKLGTGRFVLGVVTFALGLLCFMQVPIVIVE